MAQTHYFTIVGPCRDDQISWQIRFLDREGMVAVDFERLGQACEDALAKRAYHAGFAVHELLLAHDGPAKGRTDGLVSQTHPEDG